MTHDMYLPDRRAKREVKPLYENGPRSPSMTKQEKQTWMRDKQERKKMQRESRPVTTFEKRVNSKMLNTNDRIDVLAERLRSLEEQFNNLSSQLIPMRSMAS